MSEIDIFLKAIDSQAQRTASAAQSLIQGADAKSAVVQRIQTLVKQIKKDRPDAPLVSGGDVHEFVLANGIYKVRLKQSKHGFSVFELDETGNTEATFEFDGANWCGSFPPEGNADNGIDVQWSTEEFGNRILMGVIHKNFVETAESEN